MKTKALLLVLVILNMSALAQVPILNSRPSQTNAVIYLDFDGHVVSNTLWDNSNPINALPSTVSSAVMSEVWKRITEDFIPFDVNITTDILRFNIAQQNQRMRVIITPSNAWLGMPAGGVALLGSYNWGGNPGTPCFIFENMLSFSAKNIAEAASHEIGHTLGLSHQALWSNNCNLIDEYHPGLGSGSVSWAPIMGIGYYSNVTIWHTGQISDDCNSIQYDHDSLYPGITAPGFLNFFPDTEGNTYATGKVLHLDTSLVLDSGLISRPSDIDVFKFTLCNTRYISIAAKPWALDTVAFSGANLDVKLDLYDASSNLIASNAPLNRLKAQIGATLPPGEYYFVVDGSGSANYTGYGSLGRYYVRINSDNIPSLVNSIAISTLVCPGEKIQFSGSSTGEAVTWEWLISGATPSVSALPSSTLQFNQPGTYSISLATKSGGEVSCTSTVNVTVKSLEACNMTGISRLFSDAFVRVYPNPSNGLLMVESSVAYNRTEIADLAGNTVYAGEDEGGLAAPLNLLHLAKGFYFIKIYSGHALLAMQKIIIE